MTNMQERTLNSQLTLTHVLPAYSYLYHHEKAEEFGKVKNYPDNTERGPGEIDLTNLPEK